MQCSLSRIHILLTFFFNCVSNAFFKLIKICNFYSQAFYRDTFAILKCLVVLIVKEISQALAYKLFKPIWLLLLSVTMKQYIILLVIGRQFGRTCRPTSSHMW